MYNVFMKRRPSLKGRMRLSDAGDSGEQYRSAAIEPSRGTQRKQTKYLDPAVADGERTFDWDDAGLEFVGQQPRR
jgi:hypothetical protein